jgi:hypothetical protein
VKQIGRWSVAWSVTVLAFAAGTWACGVVVMPLMTRDPVIRWAVAPALGVAVAALAALWGQSFAAGENPENGPGPTLDTASQVPTSGPGTAGETFGGAPPVPAIEQNITASGAGAVAQGAMFGNVINYDALPGPATPVPPADLHEAAPAEDGRS